VQRFMETNAPEPLRGIQLVSVEELDAIRRIWVIDKHEFEDVLPGLYEEVMGRSYPGEPLDAMGPLCAEDVRALRQLCGVDRLHFEMVRELLDVEGRFRTMIRRAGLYDALEAAIERSFYDDEADAVARARRRAGSVVGAGSEESGTMRLTLPAHPGSDLTGGGGTS